MASHDCVVHLLLSEMLRRSSDSQYASAPSAIRNKIPQICHPIKPLPLSSPPRIRLLLSIFSSGNLGSLSEMTQTGTRPPPKANKITLYTGNIMTDGDRGAFLNTTMSKNNAEVCAPLEKGLMVSWLIRCGVLGRRSGTGSGFGGMRRACGCRIQSLRRVAF